MTHPVCQNENVNNTVTENKTYIISELQDIIFECGSIIADVPNGYIQSPNYPGVYPNDLSCQFQINGQPGKEIVLYFEDLQVINSIINYISYYILCRISLNITTFTILLFLYFISYPQFVLLLNLAAYLLLL